MNHRSPSLSSFNGENNSLWTENLFNKMRKNTCALSDKGWWSFLRELQMLIQHFQGRWKQQLTGSHEEWKVEYESFLKWVCSFSSKLKTQKKNQFWHFQSFVITLTSVWAKLSHQFSFITLQTGILVILATCFHNVVTSCHFTFTVYHLGWDEFFFIANIFDVPLRLQDIGVNNGQGKK